MCIKSYGNAQSFLFCSFQKTWLKYKYHKMKSFVIVCIVMFVCVTSFSQKTKQNNDTTLRWYLTYSCTIHPQYVSNMPAKCPVCKRDMKLSSKKQMKIQGTNLYTCPMASDSVFSTKPGVCPKCGMNLVEFKPTDSSQEN